MRANTGEIMVSTAHQTILKAVSSLRGPPWAVVGDTIVVFGGGQMGPNGRGRPSAAAEIAIRQSCLVILK
jgi:hypothetical protein